MHYFVGVFGNGGCHVPELFSYESFVRGDESSSVCLTGRNHSLVDLTSLVLENRESVWEDI